MASIWITNRGTARVGLQLAYRCTVETPQGTTNYTAGNANMHAGFAPQEGAVFSDKAFFVPLPADAKRWRFTVTGRQLSTKERLMGFLVRIGFLDFEKMNRNPRRYEWLFDTPAKTKQMDDLRKEFQSEWIDVEPLGTGILEQLE
jgi:hypothetical protein